ncbi:MAG: branched-chain amino acid transport system substrate-binding protein [Verrucomicrobia bacterium]|nr:MAG: branched-chain amino acid transport system substrate-binding protein [Verrucomicrobiota bacterium]
MKLHQFLFVVLPLLGISSCKKAPDASASGDIQVGEFASLTGATASFGQSSHKGTQMAIDEINADGGVLGRKIRLVTEDDQSRPGEAATVVRKMISRDHIVALLGEVASSRSLEAAPICQQAGIPMISPASTNPKVTEVGDRIFRVCFIDPFQGTVLSKFALSKNWKRVAILTDVKQDYSVGLSQFFKANISANGGEVVSEQSYSSGDKDFKAQLTAIKGAQPDAILASGYYTEAGLIALQSRELQIAAPLLGGDGWDSPSLVEVGGKAIEGSFFSNHFSVEDPAPAIQEFLKKYRAKFNAEPDAMAALGYDSAMILADAIKRAGSTESDKLRDAIAATKDFLAVTGKITLNKERNANKSAVMLVVKEGQFRYVETVAP